MGVLRISKGIALLVLGLFLGCSGPAPAESGVDQMTRILQHDTAWIRL